MPRPDDGGSRQGEDSLPDGCYQLLWGASGEIRPADGPHKKGVAGKKVPVMVQAYAAGGVAGGVDDGQHGAADGDIVPVFQAHIRLGGPPAAKNPGHGAVGHGAQPVGIVLVDTDFGMGGGFDGSISGNVVGMAVGVDDMGDPETRSFGLGQDFVGIEGRVDEGAGPGFFVADQIAEDRHPGEFYLFNYHCIFFATKALRLQGVYMLRVFVS